MAFINKSAKEIQVKIVYYGPGRCGNTTNLLYVNQKMSVRLMGKMISIDTRGDKRFSSISFRCLWVRFADLISEFSFIRFQAKYYTMRAGKWSSGEWMG